MDDPCSNAEVLRVARDPVECRVTRVAHRAGGREGYATLATVATQGRSRSHFLQTAEGELIALGPMPALARGQHVRIIRELGIGESNAGPASRLFDVVLEKAANGYCVAYRLKPPYAGELKDCDGSGNPGGKVGYAEGITSARGAHRAVCDLVAGAGKPCRSDGVQVMAPEVQYEPSGSMYYTIRTVERLGTFLDRKSQYEVRSYRVDSEGGAVRLLNKSAEDCTGNGACTPLPGGVVR